MLAKMTHFLALDALRVAGLAEAAAVQVFPLATGMAMTSAFLACAALRPDPAVARCELRPCLPCCRVVLKRSRHMRNAAHTSDACVGLRRYVIWSRVDQKTCLKAIVAANLTPVVIELVRRGDELCTDTAAVAAAIQGLTPQAIACVVTTTSCFAPRGCDDVRARSCMQCCDVNRISDSDGVDQMHMNRTGEAAVQVKGVSKLCATHAVPHVVNNAYGVQSRWLCGQVGAACRAGRVDAIVQSTDKNFLVPVGGTVVAATREWPEVLRRMAGGYPGRASVAAHLDLAMTLLHLGRTGWRELLEWREVLYGELKVCIPTAFMMT